jgi:hypothetical protein
MIQVISSTGVQYNTGRIYILDKYGKLKSPGGTTSAAWGSITGTLSSQTDLQNALNAKQDTLVSGTNIKTINTNSILGSGNLTIDTGIPHGTASGTDTYTVTITGVTSYADGDAYLIRFTNGNTTSATLQINSLPAVDLYRNNDGPLIGGDIVDGGEMLCVYNSTTNRFQVIGTAPNTLLAYVTNAESTTITKGQPVYAFGGQGDRLKVKLAYNTGDSTSAQTVGLVVSTSIAANQKGLIMVNGLLDGLSTLPTSTFSDGDPVYLGATAGTITNVKPTAPNHLVYLGFVTTASPGASGRMYIRVQNGYELYELHDVSVGSYGTKDVLWRDTATNLWKNKDVFTLMGAASSSANGYLTSTDWSTFNGKQDAITLTTTGTTGAATLVGSTLNVPQYSGTSVYLKNSTTYTSTGTTSTQILTSVLIPANTFVAGDVLRVTARLKKTGTNNSGNFAIGINTVLSPSGAVTFKTNSIVTTYPAFGVLAHAVIINATTNTQLPWPATNYGTNDIGFATAVLAGSWQENVAINWTVNQYIIFQSTLNSAADAFSLIFYMIEKL